MKLALVVATGVFCGSSCSLGPVGAWHAASAPPIVINGAATAVSLSGDRVGVFGGVAQTGQPTGTTFVYDARTDRWTQGAAIPKPRFADTVVVLRDGDVLDTGGYSHRFRFGFAV